MKIPRRNRRTVSSYVRQSMRSHPSVSRLRRGPSGPFTIWRPTCPSVRASASRRLHRPTCPRQHPVGSGHQARYPASYTARPPAEEPVTLVPLSRCLSAAGIRVLGILSRQGIQPPLRSACRRIPQSMGTRRTLAGFPCFARGRPGWVGWPLYSGNGGVHATVAWSSVAACRLSTARSLRPRYHCPSQGLTMTKHQRGFTVVHPVSLPLAGGPRTEREPLDFSLSFTPD
jgi:hypothetical protein